jgi:hypothetical protein
MFQGEQSNFRYVQEFVLSMPHSSFISVWCVFIDGQQFNEYQLNDDEVLFVLDQHAELDFYSASSLKQQSVDRHVAPTRTHYPDFEPTSFALSL